MNTIPPSDCQRLWVLSLLLVATWLYIWGLQRNLPYTMEADESIFVERSALMASTGDLNPGWFGNPGSTLIYPLAALYRFWYLWHGSPAPDLFSWFTAVSWPFYFLARLLSAAYTLLALCLTYQIGRSAFTPTTGVIGVAFLLSYPTILFHIKSVRTDSVGLFFATLICWACLQLYRQPTRRYQLLAGAAIGLGVASRYFLVLFTPLLFWLSWQARAKEQRYSRFYDGLPLALLAMVLSFALSTPYFFLDFPTAWHDLTVEGRSTHPGADGLSPSENFLWYWREIFQTQAHLVQIGFATLGLIMILNRRHLLALSLVGITIIFLAGVSLSPLHWLRWTIPILPIVALVGAHGLVTTASSFLRGDRQRLYHPLLVGLVIIAVAVPGLRSVQLSIQDATPSTQVAARLWLLQHLPAEAHLIQEPYAALLMDDPRVTNTPISLGTEQTVDDYRRAGYTHLVISSYMYDRFFAAAERYPKEVAFYQSLRQESKLLATFAPTWRQGGPTLLIYAIATP